ncbi:MAG: hypothetical protein KGM16_02285, partial [Bacteroidota bacterium]|nr:hypothetical protein [Bacteroidota bacterium]
MRYQNQIFNQKKKPRIAIRLTKRITISVIPTGSACWLFFSCWFGKATVAGAVTGYRLPVFFLKKLFMSLKILFPMHIDQPLLAKTIAYYDPLLQRYARR